MERLKFVSIFSTNLDEFFMVRADSLFDLSRITPNAADNKTGWTPAEQLYHIYCAVPALLAAKTQIYAAVMEALEHNDVKDISPEMLDADGLKQVNRFLKTELLPVLSPILIGPNHPASHPVNKRLYAAARLENKKGIRQSASFRFRTVCRLIRCCRTECALSARRIFCCANCRPYSEAMR